GKWELLKTLSPERLLALRHVATVESIGSSTRIEGVKLTDQQVESLLANLQRYSYNSRDEQEVAGYAEAMEFIYETWESLSLTENHIKQLHSILLKYSFKDEHHRGEYKKLANNVVAYDSEGREIGVIFETISPFQTPFEMQRLVDWTNQALTEKPFHCLLTIAAFIVRFLQIHPFQDGNGRVSRILTTLLLLRSGYPYVIYASLESIIEENKDLYYASLRKTQRTLKDNYTDWDSWITFFLRCLKKQKDNLTAKLERERILAQALPKLSMMIISLLKDHERLSISDLEKLTAANKNTLKVRLRELVNSGYVTKQGKARATWYVLNPA